MLWLNPYKFLQCLSPGRAGQDTRPEEVLEEIALTPVADMLHTPFSSMRPHASQLHPILVRGKTSRLQHPGTPSRHGTAQHMETSWSSPGPEGGAQSRCTPSMATIAAPPALLGP